MIGDYANSRTLASHNRGSSVIESIGVIESIILGSLIGFVARSDQLKVPQRQARSLSRTRHVATVAFENPLNITALEFT